MFSCLFKKVTVHPTAKLTAISCNRSSNQFVLGGTDGFLKVIEIDFSGKQEITQTKSTGVVFSQSLVLHKRNIIVLEWNHQYNKISSSDQEGIIVIWRFEEGQWDKEMINNRELSYVSDLKWSKQGEYLCFV